MASQDSMKSTWANADRKTWGWGHWILHLTDAYPQEAGKPVPKHTKREKIPYLSLTSQHAWILMHAFAPLAVQQAYMTATHAQTFGKLAATVLYFAAFNAILSRLSATIRVLGHRYGFLDGDAHERDGIPDNGVGRVAGSLLKGTGARVAMLIWLSYDPATQPLDVVVKWQWWAWLVAEIGLYGVVLDFWFYWYHRAMHDVDFLWKFHRRHHLTKHPNPLLTAYADDEQEFFDLAGIPLMTYFTLRAMGVPLGFYEWWICHQYIAFIEVAGHSGLRLHGAGLSTFHPLLRLFNAEIVIEDHDLHHRKGYRKSYNYGKQTRLWDRVFGTCHPRIESADANIDFDNTAYVPLL